MTCRVFEDGMHAQAPASAIVNASTLPPTRYTFNSLWDAEVEVEVAVLLADTPCIHCEVSRLQLLPCHTRWPESDPEYVSRMPYNQLHMEGTRDMSGSTASAIHAWDERN